MRWYRRLFGPYCPHPKCDVYPKGALGPTDPTRFVDPAPNLSLLTVPLHEYVEACNYQAQLAVASLASSALALF